MSTEIIPFSVSLNHEFLNVANTLEKYVNKEVFLDDCSKVYNLKINLTEEKRLLIKDGAFSLIFSGKFNGELVVKKEFKNTNPEDVYREVAIHIALIHLIPKHVPSILDWTSEYMIMSMIDGVTVEDFCLTGEKLKKSHLADIFEIFTKLALLKITHYDVHAKNIMISNIDNAVYLIDFGLSELNHIGDVTMDAKDIYKDIYSYVDLTKEEDNLLTEIMSTAAIGSTTTGTGDTSNTSALEISNRLSLCLGSTAAVQHNTCDLSGTTATIASMRGSVIKEGEDLVTTFESIAGVSFVGTTPEVFTYE